ncbi:hypothetical protein Tco_1580629 [Tanacetum coccineum]
METKDKACTIYRPSGLDYISHAWAQAKPRTNWLRSRSSKTDEGFPEGHFRRKPISSLGLVQDLIRWPNPITTYVGNKKSIGHFQVVIVLARSLLYD